VRQLLEPVDCPECGSAGAIYTDFCQVCYADVEAVGLDPVGQEAGPSSPPSLHPSVPPRFSSVVDELREIAAQAMEAGTTQGWRIVAACQRAESLLFVLKRHILQEVVLGDEQPSAAIGS
jgi:hypothetical protein